MTGSLGATGARLTKGWFTDLEVTNDIAGDITGNAATATFLTGLSDPDANTLLGWDDTDGAHKFITLGSGLSYDHATHTISSTGGSVTYSKSFVITNPTSSADGALWRTPNAITITAIHGVQVGGTNIVGMLTECDVNGLNPVVVDDSDMTITTSNVNDDGSLSNPSIDAGDYIGWATTSVSGTVTKAIITFEYTVN
jgi:hypothetical protein